MLHFAAVIHPLVRICGDWRNGLVNGSSDAVGGGTVRDSLPPRYALTIISISNAARALSATGSASSAATLARAARACSPPMRANV